MTSPGSPIVIRAHELAAACGVDPYRSRVNLWLEKTGRLPKLEEEDDRRREAMEWGVTLQPIIATVLEKAHGLETMPAPADPFERDHGKFVLQGHLDGFYANGHRGVLEIKTAGDRQAGLWLGDDAPTQYVIQTLTYMHLTGLHADAVLACLIGGQRLEVRRVGWDEETVMLMLAAAEEFAGLVTSDTAPDPDGSEATTAAIARMYGGKPDTVCQLTAEDAEAVSEYRKIRAAVKAGEEQAEALKQRLQLRMGDAAVGVYDGAPLVRWSIVTSKRLNQSRLKEELPDVHAQFCDETSYRRFTA